MNRRVFFAILLFFTAELRGQNNDSLYTGRLEQIQAQRLDKLSHLGSGQQPRKEAGPFSGIGRFVSRAPVDLGVDVGGLGPGAGPAIDAVLQKTTYGARLHLRTWGHLALHNFYNVGTGAELLSLPAADLTLAVEGSHADSPQLDYYGEGPDSSIHNRTNFRREDTVFSFRAGFQPLRDLTLACRAAGDLLHIGPGTNESLATTQSVFGPSQAPGIGLQTDYGIVGCSAQLDLRDFAEDPHKGTFADASFDKYLALDYSQFSFFRLSVLGEQYVPFFNRKRVIALRAKTELSFHSAEKVVPFYVQPTLGSDPDLRGFRRYRFYDENSISLNAEYRWEISTGFDVALFADGGKVFHRPGEFGLSRLEGSAGFGFRFKNQSERRVIARIDTGFSREGFQVWLKVPKVFF